MSSVKTLVTAVALALTAVAVPGLAIGSPAPSPRGYETCQNGNFCLYAGWDGSGTLCQWSDPSVNNTNDKCSFIKRGDNVRSVKNNTNHRVQYYTGTNCDTGRVGSTEAGQGGNLKGDYKIYSFKPQRSKTADYVLNCG